MVDPTPEPHPRWARATDDHASRVKQRLLELARTRGKLMGSVTATHIRSMQSKYDLLDLAEAVQKASEGNFSDIFKQARTLPPTPHSGDAPTD